MTDSFYPIRHWLITLVTGPVITAICDKIIYKEGGEGWMSVFVLLVFLSMIFSLPALAVYYVAFELGVKKMESAVMQKLVLNTVTIICVIITLQLIVPVPFLTLTLGYSIAATLSSFFLKIRLREEDQLENPGSK